MGLGFAFDGVGFDQRGGDDAAFFDVFAFAYFLLHGEGGFGDAAFAGTAALAAGPVAWLTRLLSGLLAGLLTLAAFLALVGLFAVHSFLSALGGVLRGLLGGGDLGGVLLGGLHLL